MKIIDDGSFSIVSSDDDLSTAVKLIGKSEIQIAIVLDSQNIFQGVITGGDMVRLVSQSLNLEHWFNSKIADFLYGTQSLTLGDQDTLTKNIDVIQLAKEKSIKYIPILDKDGKFKALFQLD